MHFHDESVSVTAPWLALSMFNVDQDEFNGLTFSVTSVSSSLNPEVRLYECFNKWQQIFTYELFT